MSPRQSSYQHLMGGLKSFCQLILQSEPRREESQPKNTSCCGRPLKYVLSVIQSDHRTNELFTLLRATACLQWDYSPNSSHFLASSPSSDRVVKCHLERIMSSIYSAHMFGLNQSYSRCSPTCFIADDKMVLIPSIPRDRLPLVVEPLDSVWIQASTLFKKNCSGSADFIICPPSNC